MNPVLRLVGADGPHSATPSRRGDIPAMDARSRASERIAAENHAAAASLSALDPRWILAVQVHRELAASGSGAAAVISPESRKRLLLVGHRLGLRSFDAHMVLAIVQDQARQGLDPLGHEAQDRLRIVPASVEEGLGGDGPTWAMAIAMSLVALLTGGTVGAICMALALSR